MDTPLARRLAENARALAQLENAQFVRPHKTAVVAVANQKGGVGKTTSTVNLAVSLAKGGLSVLVVDIDPQGNASTALGVDHPTGTPSTYDALIGELTLKECLHRCPESTNLKVCPATIDLSGAELELSTVPEREYVLDKIIDSYLSTHRDVDVVLIDCPPSLGLLTLNAFVAAEHVLVPIQTEYYALEGVSMLMSTVQRIREYLNPKLAITAILLTMVDGRTRLSADVEREVRSFFPELVMEATIPRSVKLSEAPSFGGSIFNHEPRGTGAIAYWKAALELAQRLQEAEAI